MTETSARTTRAGAAGAAPRRRPSREDLLAEAAREAGDVAALLPAFYRHVPVEELGGERAPALAALVRSQAELAATRVVGRPVIRLLGTGQTGGAGWTGGGSLVQIVTDDMPYLVDSVTAALTRIDVPVHRILHPLVVVRRDVTGALLEVLAGTEPLAAPSDALVESWMVLEVDRIADPARAAEVERHLQSVLTDVREVVEDAERMAGTARALAGELETDPPPLPPDEVAGGAALLRWLADGHFTFLGYRRYELVEPGAAGPADGDDAVALRAVLASGLGVLRRDSLAARSGPAGPDPAQALSPELLVLTSASTPSTVHRPVHPYYVGVKTFDADGRVTGEHRFLGVLTTTGLHEDVLDIPVIRERVLGVIARAGYPLDSYSGQQMLEVVQTYPRTELFSTDPDSLYETVLGVLSLAETRSLRLFCRRDPYGRFFSCLVYLPRDRYTTTARLAMQEVLLRELRGVRLEYGARIGESQHARVHFTVSTDPADPATPTDPDVPAITELLEAAVRTWDDLLLDQVSDPAVTTDVPATTDLAQRYVEALPEAYKEDFPPSTALVDACRLEGLAAGDGLDLSFYTPVAAEPGERRFKLYLAGEGITLSDVLPVLQRMGVVVVDERPYEVRRGDGVRCWIYDFGLRLEPVALEAVAGADPEDVRRRFQDAFVAAWRGACEVDRFNALVLRAGLDWRQVAVLRTYVRYARQGGSTYSQDYVEDVLLGHSRIAAALVGLFEMRTDPRLGDAERTARADQLLAETTAMIDDVAGLDADRILRGLLGTVRATLRANHWVRGADGAPRPYLSIKLDPSAVPGLPEPRPAYEVFVCSPRVEGVHLRFGPVARGGLRWSDRRDDFRTEVLGLVKAQAVKNAVIVPVGAKGGFVVKRPPAALGDPAADREAQLAEGVACYRMFISGLLDLTDDLVDGRTVPARDVVRHDGDDSYLVVAADKGTASFSDTANAVAAEYGFWLGDAFASGGSAGYDHKAMGITARGAWESVKRHFRELGVDPQTEDVTVVGIGDMSGDVFGNGMLLSRHVKLVAAFDHRHVFLDPDPDPERSYAERARLFALPRSSWDDYDRSLISDGGGVWPRTAKRVPISEPARVALGLPEGTTELTPPELVRAVLLAPAQLLWNGGIGTYVKAAAESHADVGDKANDAVRVDGGELRVRVVGEGGNLGLTQRGRIEFARAGGKVNTDAIDNSAGVDCSDHEVNIKILLDRLVRTGALPAPERNPLLAAMTDEVAALVLANNVDQNTLLGVSRAHAPAMLGTQSRIVAQLAATRGLDRRLQGLPTAAQFDALAAAGHGLTSPELAVLVAHVKLALKADVLASDLPDAEVFRARLPEYFPAPLRERFGPALREHPLRREITTTLLVNDVVDGGGLSYAFRLGEEVGASSADAVRAYAVATAVFDLPAAWKAITALGTSVPIAVADRMELEVRRLLDRVSRWLLLNRPQPLAVGAEVARFRPVVSALAPRVRQWLAGRAADGVDAAAGELVAEGVPEELARRVSTGLYTFGLLDVAEVTEIGERDATGTVEVERDAAAVAELYYALSAHLDVDGLLRAVNGLPRPDKWNALARLALRDDLYGSLRAVTLGALRASEPGTPTPEVIARWEQLNRSRLARARAALAGAAETGDGGLAAVSVATRAVASVAR